MTDRTCSFLVVLQEDLRDDQVGPITTALLQIRGVLSVTPHVADSIAEMVAESRARAEIAGKLFDVIYPDRKKP